MKLFRRKEKREVDINSLDPILQAIFKDETVDRTTALEIPIINSSVDLICNTFAMIPFQLYETKEINEKKVTKEVEDDRVRIINDDTNDTLDGFQFKKAICEDYLLGKGGYAFVKTQGNRFNGLYYVENTNITVQKNTDPIFKNVEFLVNGNTYYHYQFIKLLRNSKDGASGVGLIDEINRALRTAFKRICYEYDLTITGGSRKGFIKSQKHLDDKAIKQLREAWEKYYSGNANTVILNDGMEFQEASNNSTENQLNEKNITFRDEMRELFHISNDYDEFIKKAIMPIATAFCTALNRDFLLETEKKSFYFAPDTKELYKGAMKERFEAYEIAIKNGFKTRNEVRYLEDDDAIEGLDTITLGLGDVLLDTNSGKIYVPNTNTTFDLKKDKNSLPQNKK
nr:MAG TPA: portal protein [Caudoviricetes sp.]